MKPIKKTNVATLCLLLGFFSLHSQTVQYSVPTSGKGTNNSCFGSLASPNITGTANTFVGYQSGQNCTSGNYNTAIGAMTGIGLNTSSFNILIGYGAGMTLNGVPNNVAPPSPPRNNVLIGNWAGNNLGITNKLIIGSNASSTNPGTSAPVLIGGDFASGMVGIGTYNPIEKLHVLGNLRLESPTKNTYLKLYGWDAAIESYNSSGQKYQLIGTYEGWNKEAVYIAGYNSSNSSYFTKHVAIGGSGSETVWVNLTTKTVKVKGSLEAEDIQVKNVSLPDYVFSPDYKLRSLQEVEKHIVSEGNLPEMPKASQVAECGMNVAEMNNLLLKKVEELTLYVIQLQKQIDQMKK
ncbi:MAG: hypothetical protein SNJ71_05830 [Bacteroidales bacterium]